MGYLFLAGALLAGATKGYCGKKTGGFVKGYPDAVFANTLRMGICIFIGLALILVSGGAGAMVPGARLLLISALSGISTSVFVVAWLLSVRRGAYMMLDVFLMLGVLIPLLFGRFLFAESITPLQWCGLFLLAASACIMCSYNNSFKERLTPLSLFLLALCGISNGVTDLSQRLFVRSLPDIPIAVFNFYTYLFSAASLLLVYLFALRRAPRGERTPKRVYKMFGYILVMSVCLFLHSFLKTAAAGYLDSAHLYPLSQGGSLILSSLMAALFFREKLTAKCVVGLCVAFLALILINVF